MTSYTATQAKAHFGALLDQIQHGPVQVLKHGRVVGVMVSAQDHEAMRDFCANRLQGSLAQNTASAAAQGLTEDGRQRLLNDES